MLLSRSHLLLFIILQPFLAALDYFQVEDTTFNEPQPPILLFFQVVFHYLDATNPQLWLLLSWETLLFSDILPRFHC